ncbi:MAG: acyltransferase family protein [Faecousia sp.]
MELSKHSSKIYLGNFHLIKGIAISVIIFGHIALLFDVQKLTWFSPLFLLLDLLKTAFIPLFFIINGYGAKSVSLRTNLKKTAQSLLVPYLLVMMAFVTLMSFSKYLLLHNWQSTIRTVISVGLAFLLGLPIPGKILFGIKLSHCAIIWFFLAAFWGSNLLNLILKIKHTWVQIFVTLSLALLGYGLFQLDFTYYCIPHGLIATSFYYFGYLLKRYEILQRGLPHRWMYILLGINAFLYACWGKFDLCYGDFACFPVDYFGVMLLGTALLMLGVSASRIENKFLDLFSSIGVYSYWVLCIHSIEQKCLPWYVLIEMTESNPNMGFILALMIKVIIITSFCYLMKQIHKMIYRKRKRTYGSE